MNKGSLACALFVERYGLKQWYCLEDYPGHLPALKEGSALAPATISKRPLAVNICTFAAQLRFNHQNVKQMQKRAYRFFAFV
jgi:hypothetical protein